MPFLALVLLNIVEFPFFGKKFVLLICKYNLFIFGYYGEGYCAFQSEKYFEL
jgi:hypothetical protein|tara:strand:- start:806 stop:961 length:156 start_codon:yes stop_codon:yes gene_type:complete